MWPCNCCLQCGCHFLNVSCTWRARMRAYTSSRKEEEPRPLTLHLSVSQIQIIYISNYLHRLHQTGWFVTSHSSISQCDLKDMTTSEASVCMNIKYWSAMRSPVTYHCFPIKICDPQETEWQGSALCYQLQVSDVSMNRGQSSMLWSFTHQLRKILSNLLVILIEFF